MHVRFTPRVYLYKIYFGFKSIQYINTYMANEYKDKFIVIVSCLYKSNILHFCTFSFINYYIYKTSGKVLFSTVFLSNLYQQSNKTMNCYGNMYEFSSIIWRTPLELPLLLIWNLKSFTNKYLIHFSYVNWYWC